jgi:hypothetical protein
MRKEEGGTYASEENEGEGEAKGRQGAGLAVFSSCLPSAQEKGREKEEVAAVV